MTRHLLTRQFGLLPVGFAVAMLALPPVRADDPPPTTPTVPATPTAPATTTTPTPSPTKVQANTAVVGKVETVSATSITLKVTTQTVTPSHVVPGHVVAGHMEPAHWSGGWFGHMVPAHWTQPHTTAAHPGKPQVHNTTQSVTYVINDTPPVKIDAADPATRKTGSFADVKPGEMVRIGLGPLKEKGTDGKTTTRTVVTGIDVLTPVPDTTADPKKAKK